jgi:hypothetical protein
LPRGSDAKAEQGCRKRRNRVPDWSEIRCRFPPKSPAAFDRNQVPVCSDFCTLCAYSGHSRDCDGASRFDPLPTFAPEFYTVLIFAF